MSTQRRSGGAAALVLAIMLVAGCAAAGDSAPPADESTTPDGPTSGPTAAPTAEESPTQESPTDAEPEGDHVPAGWQEVDFGDGTFHVPPDWEIETYDAGGVQRQRALHGGGYCPHAEEMVTGLAFTGWVEGEVDPAVALEAEANRMASGAFEGRSPEVELSDLEHDGEWVAGIAAVTMDASDEPCEPVEAVFVIKATAYGSGTFVFTVIGELGHDASPTPEELVEISNSLQT